MLGPLAALLLAAARLWALLRVQASARAALGRRWEWIAAALAVALALVASLGGRLDSIELEGFAWIVALGFEVLLGSVLGLFASLLGWGLVGAASQTEAELGVRGTGEHGSVATVIVAASLAAALSLGLHRPAIAALLGSFAEFPLADPSAWVPELELGSWLIDRAVASTGLALALATPVLLTRVIVELTIASLARTGVEAASLTAVIAPALRLVAALVALGAAWSAYPEAFARGL
jgi:flagellar biosynthesis protein FliR